MSHLTFNIETIGDPNLPAELMPKTDDFDAPGNYKDPQKIIEYKQVQVSSELGRFSLSPLTGKIICLSYKYTRDGESTGVITFHGEDETAILKEFAKEVEAIKADFPILVTYNGVAFDVPFLYIGCIRTGVKYPFDFRESTSKYGTDHVDVYQYLSSFGINKRGTLADWSLRLGVAAPFGKGSLVANWYRLGEWDSIMKHCSTNVASTDAIFVKMANAGIFGALNV